MKDKERASVPVWQVCLWWAVRAFMAFALFAAPTAPKKLAVGLSLLACFFVSFAKKTFFADLNARLQTCICLTAFFGAGLGFGLDVLQIFPEYDLFLNFFGGIIGTVTGYYISISLRKPYKKKGYFFTVIMSFFVSNTFLVIREISQFFIDFYTGRNLIRCETVGDDFWLFKLVGPMLSVPEHRYLYDFSLDLVMTIVGAGITTAVLYLYLANKHREIFRIEKKSLKGLFTNFPQRCRDKIAFEIEKVREQTNTADMLLWWCIRIFMVYAFLTIENKAEGVLLLVVSLGTFAITAIHLIFPKESIFCKINYRVQTLLCIIVFLGSYCGNYINLYAYTSRFDTLLHFVSGFISATAGYYIGLTLVKPLNRKENLALCLFALAFSMTVIPIHEMVEFIGDYIWGTTNQGFMWDPLPEDVMLYKVFGHGAGKLILLKFYDTMYDMVLATTSALMSFVYMFFFLEKKRKNADYKAVTEREAVTC